MVGSREDKILKTGFAQAKAITKKYAKTFYFASLFLPKEKQCASYAVYAICKISDEAVDNPEDKSLPLDLAKIEEMIETAYGKGPVDNPLVSAFRYSVKKYNIPKDYFNEVIAGMHMDLDKNRYASFDELYLYCYRVAGVIGLIMLKILGCNDVRAEEYAVKLGVALQLTNITRDVKEDFTRGRIYLPRDEMKKFNVSEEYIREARLNQSVASLLKFQIERARSFYAHAGAGIRFLNGARSRFVILAIKEIYSGILDEIEKNRYDVFSRRAYVNNVKKCVIALTLICKGCSS
jgi:phytoene synthase